MAVTRGVTRTSGRTSGAAALAASRGVRPVRVTGVPGRTRRAVPPRAAAAVEEPATEGDAGAEPSKAAARAARAESRRARFQTELEALTVGQEVQGKVVRSRPARPPRCAAQQRTANIEERVKLRRG